MVIGIFLVNIENAAKTIYFHIDKSALVGIIFENTEDKDRFILSMAGKEVIVGDIVLHEISLQNDKTKYKNSIDLVSIEHLNSSLSVEDYILFYCMARGIYDRTTKRAIADLLKKLELHHIKKLPLNSLPEQKQIMLRCMAAHFKGVKLLICDDIMKDVQTADREKIALMLIKNFIENGCLCLLISMDKESIEDYVEHMIFL